MKIFRPLAAWWDRISRPRDPDHPDAWRQRLLYIFLNLLIVVAALAFVGDVTSSLEEALYGFLGVLITIGCRLIAARNPKVAGWVLVTAGVLFVRFFLGDTLSVASGGMTLGIMAVLGSAFIAPWAGFLTALISAIGLLPFNATTIGLVIGLGSSVWIITSLLEGALYRYYASNLSLQQVNQELTQIKAELEVRVQERTSELQTALTTVEEEQRRGDSLLRVILPEAVVEELKATNTVQPRRFNNVGVLFCDIVDFTEYCDQHAPEQVLTQLQTLVEAFEEMATRHLLQKIKTAGDAFMTTAGLFRPLDNPVLNCVQCGLDMVRFAPTLPPRWQVRVGIHLGAVIAGIVGKKQYLFDILGDTVNLAARLQETGRPGTVTISSDAWKKVAHLAPRQLPQLVDLKGKGHMTIYRVDGHTESDLNFPHQKLL